MLIFSATIFGSNIPGLKHELNAWFDLPTEMYTQSNDMSVAISIKVDEFGHLKVTGVNASDDKVADYIAKVIESKKLDASDPRIGSEYYYKLRFRKL